MTRCPQGSCGWCMQTPTCAATSATHWTSSLWVTREAWVDTWLGVHGCAREACVRVRRHEGWVCFGILCKRGVWKQALDMHLDAHFSSGLKYTCSATPRMWACLAPSRSGTTTQAGTRTGSLSTSASASALATRPQALRQAPMGQRALQQAIQHLGHMLHLPGHQQGACALP